MSEAAILCWVVVWVNEGCGMEPNDEEEEAEAATAPEEKEGPTMKEVELRVVRDNRNTVLSLLIRDDGRRNSIADIEISTAMDDARCIVVSTANLKKPKRQKKIQIETMWPFC